MRFKYSLLLFITAIIWGAAFVAQSAGMDYIGPYTFNCVRCYLGVIALLPVIIVKDIRAKETPWNDKRLITGGIVCGLFLFLASTSQQIGIVTTSAGKAGFITAFYIVMVPVISLFLRKKPGKFIWISVFAAVVGLFFLCIKDTSDLSIARGDYYILACAILFAFQILAVDKFAPGLDCLKLACYEFLVCAILGTGLMIWEKPDISSVLDAWIPLGYAGFFSCGIAYTLQMVAQKQVKPAVASILMSMESVFSVLFGAIILKEVLTARELLGCAIMFVAVILAELNPDALFEKVVARGERVYLREITSSDTDDIIRWRNSENVVKNFIYRKPVTRKDHRNWLKTKVRTGQVRQFILCLNDTGKGIGSIYFRDIDNEKHTCEFGIFIGEQDATGKGYGYEGQKLAMDIAFGEMGMKEVELRVLDGNIPAIRNYEKCGFKVVPEHEEFTESKEKVIFMKAVKTS